MISERTNLTRLIFLLRDNTHACCLSARLFVGSVNHVVQVVRSAKAEPDDAEPTPILREDPSSSGLVPSTPTPP